MDFYDNPDDYNGSQPVAPPSAAPAAAAPMTFYDSPDDYSTAGKPDDHYAFTRGLVTGGLGSIEDAGEATNVLNRKFGGDKDSPIGKLARGLKDAGTPGSEFAMQVPGVQDIDSFGEAATYVGEQLGSGIASTAPSIAGAMLGGAIGGAGGAPAGGVGAAPGAAIGAWTGAAIPAFISGVGSTSGDLRANPGIQKMLAEGKITEDQLDNYAIGGGLVVGALDVAAVGKVMRLTGLGKEATKQVIKDSIIKSIGKGALAEGGTEALQQIVTEVAQDLAGGSTELGQQVLNTLNSAIGGALAGGTFGGVFREPGTAEETGPSITPEQPGTTGNVQAPAAPTADPKAPVTSDASTPGNVGGANQPAPPVSPPETGDPVQANVPGVAAPPLAQPGEAPVKNDVTRQAGMEPTITQPGADISAALGGQPIQPAGHGLPDAGDAIEYEDPEGADIQRIIDQRLAKSTAVETGPDPTLNAALNTALQPVQTPQQDVAPTVQPVKRVRGKKVVPEPAPAVTPVAVAPEAVVPQPAAAPELAPVAAAPEALAPVTEPVQPPLEAQAPIDPTVAAAPVEAAPALAPEPAPMPSGIVAEQPQQFFDNPDDYNSQTAQDARPAPEATLVRREDQNAPTAVSVAPVDDFDPYLDAGVDREAPKTFHSQKLDTAVRSAMAKMRDPLMDTREAQDAIDAVVRTAAKGVGRSTPVAQFIANEVPKAIETIRKVATSRKVREFKQGEQKHEVAQKVAEERKAEEKKPTRRAKYTKKSAEDLEEEDARTTHEAAAAEVRKPKEKQDQRLIKIHEHVEARKRTTVPKEKVEHTKAIAALQRERVEERRAEETKEKAEREEARKKIAGYSAERKQQVIEALEKGEPVPEAEEKPEDAEQRELAKAKERTESKERGEAIEKVLAENPLSPKITDRPDWQKAISTYIKHLLSKSPEVGDNVSTKRSAAEALLTYAKGFTDGSKSLDNITDFLLAMHAYTSGDKREFWSYVANKRPSDSAIGSYGDVPGRNVDDEQSFSEASDIDEDSELAFSALKGWEAVEGEPREAMRQEGGLSEFNVGKTKVKPIAHRKGGALLHQLLRSNPLGGLTGITRRMQAKRLRKLVGDVDTYFISGEDMRSIAAEFSGAPGADADGAYILLGGKPTIILNEENWGKSSARDLHSHMHEMTHAATIRAIELNEGGIKDILDAMVTHLKKVPAMTSEFGEQYGLTNAKELVAEAFTNPRFQEILRKTQVPDDIRRKIDRLTQGSTIDSWWDYIVQAIANGLGMLTGSRTNNYLEYTISLGQWGMQSTEAQEISRKVYADMPSHPLDTTAFLKKQDQLVDGVENMLNGAVMPKLRKTGHKVTSTRGLMRKSLELFGGEDNPLHRLGKHLLGGQSAREKLVKAGNDLGIKQNKLRKKNPKIFAEMEDIAHAATDAQVDPTERNDNKHLGKSGMTHYGQRRIMRELQQRYRALPKEYQDLLKETHDHFQAQENERVHRTVESIAETRVDGGHALPAGETVDSVTKWVTEGDIDKEASQQTQRDKDIQAFYGEAAKYLADTKSMRRIKGFYIPRVRYGKNYYSVTHEIDVPAGATVEGDDKNVLVFKDEDDAKAYLDTTDEHIQTTKIRWVDPNTGKTVTKMTLEEDPQNPGTLMIPEKRYVVTVQNKTVRMRESLMELRAMWKQDNKNPKYRVSDMGRLDNKMNGGDQFISRGANSLIDSVKQQVVGNATVSQQAVINGIRDAEIRRLAGSRAAHRRLRRKNVRGYEDDLVRTTMTSSRTMAGHIHNLRHFRELGRLDRAAKKYIEDHKYDGGEDRIKRQELYDEMISRVNAQASNSEITFGSQLSRLVRGIGYGVYLATPAYLGVNAMQTLMFSLPMLGARHGNFRATRELWRAMSDLGGGGLGPISMARIMGHAGMEGLRSIRKDWLSTERYVADRSPTDWVLDIMKKAGIKDYDTVVEPVLRALEAEGLDATAANEAAHAAQLSGEGGLMEGAISLIDRVTSPFQQVSAVIELVNRSSVAIAAARLAKQDGMSPAQMTEHALNMTEATQGGYQDANNPNILSTPAGSIVFAFKRYAVFAANAYYGAIRRILFNGPNTDMTRGQAVKTLLNLSVAMVAFAGLAGLPPWEIVVALGMVSKAIGGDDADEWGQSAQKWMGDLLKNVAGAKTARALGEALMHGFSRMEPISTDLSSRMGNSSMILFNTPDGIDKENMLEFFGSLFLGAPGAIGINVMDKLSKGDISGAFQAVAPRMVRDTITAYNKHEEGAKNKFGRQTEKPYSMPDTIKTALGFRPAEAARSWETGSGAKFKKARETRFQRTKLMQSYTQADNSSDRNRAMREIEQWNRTHQGKERITRGNLVRSRNRERQLRKEEGR